MYVPGVLFGGYKKNRPYFITQKMASQRYAGMHLLALLISGSKCQLGLKGLIEALGLRAYVGFRVRLPV